MDEGEDFGELDKHVNLAGVHVMKKSATTMKKKKPCATAHNIAIVECTSDILADVTFTKDNEKESSTIRLHEKTQIDRSYEQGEIIDEEGIDLSAIFIDHQEHLMMENSVMIPHELEYEPHKQTIEQDCMDNTTQLSASNIMTEMIQGDDLGKAEKRCAHGASESSSSKRIKLEPINKDTGTQLQSIHMSNEMVTEVSLSDVMSGKTAKETNVIDECSASDVLCVRLKTNPQKY